MTARVAFFTPLPPIQSGIAQYSAELLPLLGQALTIDVFIDRYQPTVDLGGRARIVPAGHFVGEQRRRPYDAIIYQMGNSPAHAYMVPLVERYPGLLVLHDYVLHHLQVWLAVNRRGSRAYRAEMERRYGAAGAEVARQTLRGRMPAAIFDYPLCEGMVEASPLVAVHSDYAAGLVERQTGRTDIARLPMGVPLYRLPPVTAARERLGLPVAGPIVASLGHLSPHKRMDVALRAFRRVRKRFPQVCYLIAGSESPELDLDRQVRMLDLTDAVRRLGYIDEATVPDLLAAADVVVTLRYPTAGETSASLLRILAAGKAVITTRAGAMTEVPAEVAVSIAPDEVEEEVLVEVLLRLLTDAPLRQRLERQARSFIEQRQSLPLAAAAYLRALERLLGRPLSTPEWTSPAIDARAGGPRLAPPAASLAEPAPHPLADRLAEALVDLGLAQHTATRRRLALALTELGLAPGQPAAPAPGS